MPCRRVFLPLLLATPLAASVVSARPFSVPEGDTFAGLLDHDGDGTFDTVWYQGEHQRLYLRRSTPSGLETVSNWEVTCGWPPISEHTVLPGTRFTGQWPVGDADGDGRDEILVPGTAGNENLLLVVDAHTGVVDHQIVLDHAGTVTGALVIDAIPGGGDEVLACQEYAGIVGETAIYRYQEGAWQKLATVPTDDAWRTLDHLADLDGDGRPEIFTLDTADDYNSGTGAFTSFASGAPVSIPLRGDRWPEAYLSPRHAGLPTPLPMTGANHEPVFLVPQPDGLDLCRGSDGQVLVTATNLLLPDGALFHVGMVGTSFHLGPLADFDGDGLAEAPFACQFANGGASYLGLFGGLDAQGAPLVLDARQEATMPFPDGQPTDLDGDGRPEISVAFTGPPAVNLHLAWTPSEGFRQVYRNDQGYLFPHHGARDGGLAAPQPLTDGVPAVVPQFASGQMSFIRTDGQALAVALPGVPGDARVDCGWADLEQDGDLELLVRADWYEQTEQVRGWWIIADEPGAPASRTIAIGLANGGPLADWTVSSGQSQVVTDSQGQATLTGLTSTSATTLGFTAPGNG